MAKWRAGLEKSPKEVSLYRLSADIRVFGRRFSWQESLHLLQVLEHAAVQPDGVVCSLELAALGWARHWSQCMHLLNKLPKALLDTACYNAAASACSTASSWRRAFQVVENLSTLLTVSTTSVNSLFPCFKDRGRWMKAMELLELLSLSRRCSADTQTITGAIDSCRHGRKWEVAEQLLGEAAPLEPKRSQYEGVMQANHANWERTVSLLSQAKQRTCSTNSSLYRQAVSSCLGCRCTGQALQVLHSCKAHGIQPSVPMCGAILATCDSESMWWLALSVLRGEMRQGAFVAGAVDESMCCSAVAALKARSQWQWAARVFDHATPCADVLPADMSISCIGRATRWALGMNMLRRLGSRRLDTDTSTWGVDVGITGACGGCWYRALALLARAQQRHLQASTRSYTSIISQAEHGEEWRRAVAILHDLQQQNLGYHFKTCWALSKPCVAVLAGRVHRLLAGRRWVPTRDKPGITLNSDFGNPTLKSETQPGHDLEVMIFSSSPTPFMTS